MDSRQRVSSYEYKNVFLAIVIRQAPELGSDAFFFCSGINLSRFVPLARQSFGICSNPAFKGLQLLRADVSAFVREKGVTPRSGGEKSCGDTSPREDGWYRESMVLEKVSKGFLQELLRFSVTSLLQRVLPVWRPGLKLPAFSPIPGSSKRILKRLVGRRDKIDRLAISRI